MRSWVNCKRKIAIQHKKNLCTDEVLATKAGDQLNVKQKEGIHQLFSQGVKHKMRMNILRQVSKTSEFQVGRMREGEDPIEEGEDEGSTTVRKISTASLFTMVAKTSHPLLYIFATSLVRGQLWLLKVKLLQGINVSHDNVYSNSNRKCHKKDFMSKHCRKVSQKENTLKWREHNLFTKKVPRDAEAANIQVRKPIRACFHLPCPGGNNPTALGTPGCIHPTELSCAPGGFLRDQQANKVPCLAAGSPWNGHFVGGTWPNPWSTHDRSFFLQELCLHCSHS